MKIRMIIEGETESFTPEIKATGEIAGMLAVDELNSMTVTRVHLTKLDDEPAPLCE